MKNEERKTETVLSTNIFFSSLRNICIYEQEMCAAADSIWADKLETTDVVKNSKYAQRRKFVLHERQS